MLLVLLIIFMVTAPLLTQGVKVDLPQAASEPVDEESQEPLVVTVNAEGDYYLNVGETPDSPIDNDAMVTLVAAVLKHKPGTQVLIRGDGRVRRQLTVVSSGPWTATDRRCELHLRSDIGGGMDRAHAGQDLLACKFLRPLPDLPCGYQCRLPPRLYRQRSQC